MLTICRTGEEECNGAGVAEAATRTTIVKGTADKHSCTCGKQKKKRRELAKVATVVAERKNCLSL